MLAGSLKGFAARSYSCLLRSAQQWVLQDAGGCTGSELDVAGSGEVFFMFSGVTYAQLFELCMLARMHDGETKKKL